ncbi:MFS transporter [Cohaesibacter celericrescens]|uniref:MFS transporter n=1 Tax=Cohaesibacter celericrescens TaxID=2067669 RepID=UPI003567DED1
MPNRYLILALMFFGMFSTAATVPYMGYFIVEGLGKEPWMISIYAVLVTSMILVVNRFLGRRIDEGGDIRAYIFWAIIAYIVALAALLVFTSYWTLISIYAAGISVASGSMSVMFSFARIYADASHIDAIKFNAQIRAMASLAWMIAPAGSFTMAGLWGHMIVFQVALGLGFLWLLVWHLTLKSPFRRISSHSGASLNQTTSLRTDFNSAIWIAAAVCLFLSLGNSLVLSASPLYLIKEIHLPASAPGLSLTVKCFFEVIIILGTPNLIKKIGLRNALIVSSMLAVASSIYLAQIKTMTEMFIAAAIEGTYFGIFAAVGVSFVQSFSRGRIGHATSIFSNGLFMGSMIGGSMMGILANFTDFRTVILCASLPAILAAITLVFTRGSDSEAEKLPA